ncbi:MAG: hypothetical protein HUJ24_05990, partial [Rhodobacteraceae bacterium]|nr:hypothetical protein [Paracoccaceae bacterium]
AKALIHDLPLFSAAPPPQPKASAPSPVLDRLADALPDTMSPREALDLVYELKSLAEKN